MLNPYVTLGCFAVSALSGYHCMKMRRRMPVSAMHLGINALFLATVGIVRVYVALFDNSFFQRHVYSARTFEQEVDNGY